MLPSQPPAPVTSRSNTSPSRSGRSMATSFSNTSPASSTRRCAHQSPRLDPTQPTCTPGHGTPWPFVDLRPLTHFIALSSIVLLSCGQWGSVSTHGNHESNESMSWDSIVGLVHVVGSMSRPVRTFPPLAGRETSNPGRNIMVAFLQTTLTSSDNLINTVCPYKGRGVESEEVNVYKN